MAIRFSVFAVDGYLRNNCSQETDLIIFYHSSAIDSINGIGVD